MGCWSFEGSVDTEIRYLATVFLWALQDEKRAKCLVDLETAQWTKESQIYNSYPTMYVQHKMCIEKAMNFVIFARTFAHPLSDEESNDDVIDEQVQQLRKFS